MFSHFGNGSLTDALFPELTLEVVEGDEFYISVPISLIGLFDFFFDGTDALGSVSEFTFFKRF